MSYFYEPAARTAKETLPGVQLRTWWGERMMLSLVDLAPHAEIPPHSHPAEQVGMVLQGDMLMTIGEETHHCKVGTTYIVPADVQHSVAPGADGAQALEAFAPIREEYKFPD